MNTVLGNEFYDVAVGNPLRLAHSFVVEQKFFSPAAVSDQEFAIDQFVPYHLIHTQKPT